MNREICQSRERESGFVFRVVRGRMNWWGRFFRVGAPCLPARTTYPGLLDLNPVGIRGRSVVWRGIFLAANIKQRSKLHQKRNMPPRDGAREWGGAGGYKDFAPDGAN